MSFLQRILFLTVYSVGYLGLALATLGGGHGSLLLVYPLVTWILFIGAFLVMAKADNRLALTAIILLVWLHYLASLVIGYLVESGDHFHHTVRMFLGYPISATIAISWYLAGQIVFWILLWRRLGKQTS